jgi:hypothetical protein
VIGVLKTALQHDLGWSETDYANLVLAFQNAHSVGMLLGGRLIDWLGTRVGFALARVAWSLAAMAHGMMTWLAGLPGGAFCLWFRRSRVLPASLKATAECFQEGTGWGDGNLHAGTNARRNYYAAHRTLDHDPLGLALGVLSNWRSGICLGGFVVMDLPKTRRAPTLLPRRIGIYSKWPTLRSKQNWMGEVALAPATVGTRAGKIHD